MKTTFAIKWLRSLVVVLATLFVTRTSGEELEAPGLAIAWADNYLTISGSFPGRDIRIHYLEAYCRSGSTDRDWNQTVIGHTMRLIESSVDHQHLKLAIS